MTKTKTSNGSVKRNNPFKNLNSLACEMLHLVGVFACAACLLKDKKGGFLFIYYLFFIYIGGGFNL